MLILNAMNVHQGGGAVLLGELLKTVPLDIEVIAFLDTRYQLPSTLPKNIRINFVYPTLLKRLSAEYKIYKILKREDKLFCFGNLPPIFKPKSSVSIFLQNRYLVDTTNLLWSLPIRSMIKLMIEKIWLRWLTRNNYEYVVQTQSMKKLADTLLKKSVKCLPIIPTYLRKIEFNNSVKHYDFIYVASGEPHKNHSKLFEAWCILADNGLFPSLVLTISKKDFPNLDKKIKELIKEKKLNLKNVGIKSYKSINRLYSKSKALIYPSKFESFGLPLIEANQMNLKIVASELDYVRDIIDPDEAFDPNSPLSIARAVMRLINFNVGKSDGCKIADVYSRNFYNI